MTRLVPLIEGHFNLFITFCPLWRLLIEVDPAQALPLPWCQVGGPAGERLFDEIAGTKRVEQLVHPLGLDQLREMATANTALAAT